MNYSQNKDGNLVATFTSGIVRERSITPVAEDLGEAKCTMIMHKDEDNIPNAIEWEIQYADGGYSYEHIGLWFRNKELTDYDGLFSLPNQAIAFIRHAGFKVDELFEN